MDIKNKLKNPYIMIVVMAFLIALNLIFLWRGAFREVDLSKSSTQTMYQDSFGETKAYPDLLLRNIVKGKEVKVARDIRTYDTYGTFGRDEEDGNPFDRHYLTDNDYTRWFTLYAGSVTVDESLTVGEETEEIFSPLQQDFTDIGEANDMLRYSFALNREKVQQASAFWYSWYYNTFSEKEMKEKGKDAQPNIYVNLDGAEDTDCFVAVWTDNEDLYFMPEEKYEEYKR